MPIVSRITIFPLKSGDPFSCAETKVNSSGALQHDRQFALVDVTGRLINANRAPLIQQLRIAIDPVRREFQVAWREPKGAKVPSEQALPLFGQLDEHGRQLSDWLSQALGLEVSIAENVDTGFPDDLKANGPTIVSTATIEAVARWFPELIVDEIRRRFRANIEVEGVDPFWEDRLFRADLEPQPFWIGSTLFVGTNPCQRCAVPTRDSQTGEATPSGFAKRFSEQRQLSLPDWSPREHFDHYYRLTTNTKRTDQRIGVVRIGDTVEIVSSL